MTDNLTRAEVAEFMRVSTKTVDRWIKERIIPSIKLPGRVLIPRRKFETWFERNTVKPARVTQ